MKLLSSRWIYAASLLLAACAQPYMAGKAGWQAQTDIPNFVADGRLSVKMNEKGSYANFDWTYQNQVQTIDVNTPIGTTLGQLCQDGQGVVAVDAKGRKYQAGTAGELSEQLLGFSLPVQYLHVWANGQWVKDAPYQLLPDGRLQQFEWTISRSLDNNGAPRTLLLESSRLTLRLVFDEMQKISNTDAPKQCAARG